MLDITKLGASRRDGETNAPLVQAMNEIDDGSGDTESFGEVAVYGALGVTSLPYPANDAGHAEGVMAAGIGGSNGAVIGARDTRTADVTAQLAPGDTCLHATGDGFDSRVFCKDKVVAIVIGDDMVLSLDRKNQKITISHDGMIFEMKGGPGKQINLSTGGAGIQITERAVFISGQVVLGGRIAAPTNGVAYGVAGPANLVSTNVFIGL
jgi:hypothetical protein